VGTAVFFLGAQHVTSIEGRIDVQIHIKAGNDDGWSLKENLDKDTRSRMPVAMRGSALTAVG
jgi:hypothetical protein